jgi:CheY-like chemotaxis protein
VKEKPTPEPESREQIQAAFRQLLRQADRLLIEGNFEGAQAELAKAQTLDPRNPFIHAFQERISIFQAKANPAEAERTGDETPAPAEAADAAPAAAPGVPGHAGSEASRAEVEEEFKRRYTEEVRKAEERAEKLLAEERSNLEMNFMKQRLDHEREFERVKRDFEKDYQGRLSEEIRKTEVRLEGEYQSELARLEGDLRTKLNQQFQADLVEERERIKTELRGLAERERHSVVEMEQSLRADFDKRLAEELRKHEAELRDQLQEQHRREEERLKIELTSEFEDRMNYEVGKLREEYEKQRKKGEDVHKVEITKSRQAQEELGKKLKEEFNRKLLESVRKAEAAYEEQASQRIKEEQEQLRTKMEQEFRAGLEGERRTLREEYEKLKASLEEASKEEASRMRQQADAKLAEQTAAARKNLEEEFERKNAASRNDLESKYQADYEEKLAVERERIRAEADARVAAEKARMASESEASLREQGEKLKAVRAELRGQMEQEALKHAESIAAEYEARLDLLGVRIPETKPGQISFYREAMLARYAKGSLDIEDAKKLLQLKEMLNLTFDEHLNVETEVRLKTYSDRVRQLVVSGSLDPSDEGTLGKLKDKYGITDEESRALEHHLLASFGKLRNKGRILVADDDKLLLATVGDMLTDAGYGVVTAPDIDTALTELRAAPFDLILSDIKFSDNEFEGFAFFKKVQGMPQYAGLPFIFMSALTDGVIVRSGVQLGVDDYLTKPVEPELLTAVIEGKLKRYRAMKFQ